MVVPDFDLISEIMMVAEGFTDARLLARKFITLYSLCKELLSKQVCLFDELNEKNNKMIFRIIMIGVYELLNLFLSSLVLFVDQIPVDQKIKS
jgi:hypothetical protein